MVAIIPLEIPIPKTGVLRLLRQAKPWKLGNSRGKSKMISKLEITRCRCSEARGTRSSGAHFRGVDAETEMGEVGLAEGHEAGI